MQGAQDTAIVASGSNCRSARANAMAASNEAKCRCGKPIPSWTNQSPDAFLPTTTMHGGCSGNMATNACTKILLLVAARRRQDGALVSDRSARPVGRDATIGPPLADPDLIENVTPEDQQRGASARSEKADHGEQQFQDTRFRKGTRPCTMIECTNRQCGKYKQNQTTGPKTEVGRAAILPCPCTTICHCG